MNIKDTICTVPDWPIKGVMFRDITTLMQNPTAFRETCDQLYTRYQDMDIDKVIGIDARGFIFGAVLAYQLRVGFIPIRKKGKLPPQTISQDYALEYGSATIEISANGIEKGEKCLIVDDLIATGGTIYAATQLVESLGGEVVECAFIVELPDLKGKEKIKQYPIFTLTEFEGQ